MLSFLYSYLYKNKIHVCYKLFFDCFFFHQALLADSKVTKEKVDPLTNLAMTDDKHRTRIFILISKSLTDSELSDQFSPYGNVAHVQILKDKATGESKVGSAITDHYKCSGLFRTLSVIKVRIRGYCNLFKYNEEWVASSFGHSSPTRFDYLQNSICTNNIEYYRSFC